MTSPARPSAHELGIDEDLTWRYAVVADGVVVAATVALVATRQASRRTRLYVWVLLGGHRDPQGRRPRAGGAAAQERECGRRPGRRRHSAGAGDAAVRGRDRRRPE